jgi:hypothetical protein
VSASCWIGCNGDVEWRLTKESGRMPVFCAPYVAARGGVVPLRIVSGLHSVLVLKVVGAAGRFEVLVAPLSRSTVEWVCGEIVVELVDCVKRSAWAEVEQTCAVLSSIPECEGGCRGGSGCGTELLWREVGWRRVRVPEVEPHGRPSWWSGVSDGVGDCGAMYGPWLRCPCGILVWAR